MSATLTGTGSLTGTLSTSAGLPFPGFEPGGAPPKKQRRRAGVKVSMAAQLTGSASVTATGDTFVNAASLQRIYEDEFVLLDII